MVGAGVSIGVGITGRAIVAGSGALLNYVSAQDGVGTPFEREGGGESEGYVLVPHKRVAKEGYRKEIVVEAVEGEEEGRKEGEG
jgi:hypothetical protein